MDQLFSCKTASQKTAMSEEFFRTAIKNKEIEVKKFGTNVRFTEDALIKFMESKGYELEAD